MNLLSQHIKATIVALGSLALGATSGYSLNFNQNVKPDVIFGDGNANGSFTTDLRNNVEVGLRGKLRHNALGDPENTFNSNGDGTYSFDTGVAPTQSAPTGKWSFEWSINVNFDGASARVLSDLTYALGIDLDPSLGVLFSIFDPITTAYADHALGTNSTPNGDGFVAADGTEYGNGLDTYYVAQNSWKPHWFNGTFDPTIDGTYDFFIAAYDGNTEIARTDIQIIAGAGGAPVPDSGSAAAMLGAGLVTLLGLRRFAKRS